MGGREREGGKERGVGMKGGGEERERGEGRRGIIILSVSVNGGGRGLKRKGGRVRAAE